MHDPNAEHITKIPKKTHADYWNEAVEEINPHDLSLRKLMQTKNITWRDIDKRAKELQAQDKPKQEEKGHDEYIGENGIRVDSTYDNDEIPF